MDWLSTASEIVALLTGLVGLIGTAVGAFYAIKNFIQLNKEKSKNEIWSMIMNFADAAMKEVEFSNQSGADKKTTVIESVKSGCAALGLDISEFIDQLSAYIDDTIDFVNKMNKNK